MGDEHVKYWPTIVKSVQEFAKSELESANSTAAHTKKGLWLRAFGLISNECNDVVINRAFIRNKSVRVHEYTRTQK